MTEWLKRNVWRGTGTLAVVASLLILSVAALRLASSPGARLAGLSDQVPPHGLGSVGGDRRLVRVAVRDGARVVCAEPPRTTRQVASAPAGNAAAPAADPRSAAATVRLRDAGWLLCNAYADGVLDRAAYAAALVGLTRASSGEPALRRLGRARARPGQLEERRGG